MSYLIRVGESIKALLTSFLRKPRNQAYLASAAAPVVDYNDELIALASESRYRCNITGQVIYLERLLNDLFDVDLRRIYIIDFEVLSSVFLYTSPELKPRVFSYLKSEDDKPILYVYTRQEIEVSYRFTVMVPAALYDTLSVDDFNRMRANLDLHKTAGTNYQIIRA